MTEFVQPLSQGISRLQVGSIHDVDNFDTDQFSGSLRYVDDHNHHPIIEENVKRKVDKKMRKKEEENEKRAQRQREKDEKRAREQEEKERKKLNNEKQSISRKRIVTMQPISKSKAKIMMLDDSEEYVELGKEDSGKILYNRVCDLMRLEEKDYFGLTFVDNENHKCWLDNDKRARGQLKGHDPVFYFQVKFYPPEPALLQEDITRFVD
ncbi:unnamed protein product [Rotaria magnacalcarata]|uniref:FERM domain-containing protein n=1 Tax=Rotaria magnacalcarata TaxID=392030 RepID=A0A8S2K0D8_9BILA|nr:unnamed protein product [Rotaria magnacalcarata]CAF3822542.1 unnamed protein product [Rotaria magnacalcarata]